MSLFEKIVQEALDKKPALTALRIVVEKELLHHDILRILSGYNFLKKLTFMGGTCLRACYGGIRLSEDLDFAANADFSRDELASMGNILVNCLCEKYGLRVEVSEPVKDTQNVDTWKIKIQTRPERKHLPAQRIHIDICSISAYEQQPMLLLNPYGVDMGTAGLVIQAQSQEEIFTDKLIAFALRANRIKYRDLWDILWLHQQDIEPRFELIAKKLSLRKCLFKKFLSLFCARRASLIKDDNLFFEFKKEMQRFLPQDELEKITHDLWSAIAYLMERYESKIGGLV